MLHEERALQTAMIASDVEQLERLLYVGQTIDKAGRSPGRIGSGVVKIFEPDEGRCA